MDKTFRMEDLATGVLGSGNSKFYCVGSSTVAEWCYSLRKTVVVSVLSFVSLINFLCLTKGHLITWGFL